ncbi:hypothetical protein EG350_07370 [Chryseobacterium shandongense]|nr:hypothetical protein EG350_07370 [Chryseobacterium shandongense]
MGIAMHLTSLINVIIFFCLKTKETKETKIQDWNLKAKKCFYSLKIPKLVRIYYWFFGSVFMSHPDSGIFLTFIKLFSSRFSFLGRFIVCMYQVCHSERISTSIFNFFCHENEIQ